MSGVKRTKGVELARCNTVARWIFDNWPNSGRMDFSKFWDDDAGEARDGGGDTLLLFILREAAGTLDFNGSPDEAVGTLKGVLDMAEKDMFHLYGKLCEMENDPRKQKHMWTPVPAPPKQKGDGDGPTGRKN